MIFGFPDKYRLFIRKSNGHTHRIHVPEERNLIPSLQRHPRQEPFHISQLKYMIDSAMVP
jgi:hypothetical protein